jgi:hypothetical protein
MPGREKIDRVAECHEAATAELYRTDGSKRFSDDEHKERETTLKREFNAALDSIEADIEQRIATSEEKLLSLENADPTDSLTNEELARANAKRDFVADDCFNLPLKQLEKRCRSVLASGDRPTIFLYAHHAAQRVGEPKAYNPNNPAARDEEGAHEIREVVAELEAKCDPERARRLEQAKAGLSEARDLRDYAYCRRRGAKSAGQLYMKQTYGNVAERFSWR